MMAVMMVMVAMTMMMVMMPHPPAAETAEGAVPAAVGAIVPEERAGEQTSDKGQYKNEDDETEHCYSPFAECFARPAP